MPTWWTTGRWRCCRSWRGGSTPTGSPCSSACDETGPCAGARRVPGAVAVGAPRGRRRGAAPRANRCGRSTRQWRLGSCRGDRRLAARDRRDRRAPVGGSARRSRRAAGPASDRPAARGPLRRHRALAPGARPAVAPRRRGGERAGRPRLRRRRRRPRSAAGPKGSTRPSGPGSCTSTRCRGSAIRWSAR